MWDSLVGVVDGKKLGENLITFGFLVLQNLVRFEILG